MSAAILELLAGASMRATIAAVSVGAALCALRVTSSAARHAAWTAVLIAMLAIRSFPCRAGGCHPAAGRRTIRRGGRRRSDGCRRDAGDPCHRCTWGRREARLRGDLVCTPRRELAGARRSNAAADVAWRVRHNLSARRRCHVPSSMDWVARRRPHRAREPAARIAVQPRVRESRALAAPVTVGVVAPVVLLPSSWRRWSGETLRAVLAHSQSAHVRRQSPCRGSRARQRLRLLVSSAGVVDRAHGRNTRRRRVR